LNLNVSIPARYIIDRKRKNIIHNVYIR